MAFHRIYGTILRYIFLFRHSLDRVMDAFYWPTLDLIIWGLTSSFLQSFAPENSRALLIVVSGIIFWLIAWRGQAEITINLLEDLWNKNLINIFVSPLKFSEWIVSFLVFGVIKGLVSFFFASFVAFILYKVHILAYGFSIIPFIGLLIMTGWWVGFFVAGLILRFGSRVQILAWAMIAVIAPFAAVYYPVSILPAWAQTIALWMPMSYIFEGIREIAAGGALDTSKLITSFFLSLVYLTAALFFLKTSFKKILKRGLVKVF